VEVEARPEVPRATGTGGNAGSDIVAFDDRESRLQQFNVTVHSVPDLPLPDLFESGAARTPQRLALVLEDESLAYEELNARANRLAHCLIGLGVGPEALVGVCLERSVELVVALLGILKAGGAYLPLDPGYPKARLEQMIADAAPMLVLSTSAHRATIPPSAEVVALDAAETKAKLTGAPATNPTDRDRALPLGLRHPVYVIYTSGSTGTPKGTVIEHRSLVNHMAWMCDAYPVDERDRVLFRTSVNFDAAVWELWLPLLCGATLCVAPATTQRDPAALLDYMNRLKVTVAQFVPTLLSVIYDMAEGRPGGLRIVFAGGEVLTSDLARKVVAGWNIPIVNLYGPTEATIQVTHYCCEGDVPDSPTIPIGSPIWNTAIYVLDGKLAPVPVGASGELYVAGAALGRGYLSRPALTADRFVADPYSREIGARMYRSGDLVRWRPDGVLEYLGRVDGQIKIRGFRVELGEIESVLRGHEQVDDAVVVVREHAGEKQLVGYVIAHKESRDEVQEQSSIDANEIVAVLKQHSAVRDAVVLAAEDAATDNSAVAYVVMDSRVHEEESRSDNLALWQEVFEETYRQEVRVGASTVNTIGWNSSYTGELLTTDEMSEWVDSTVERIQRAHPSHVLEIGCGSGLLLFRIAPKCARYVGTDVSQNALDYVRRHATALGPNFPSLALRQQPADDFSGIDEQAFDCVILNSVVQYFPTIEYLVGVLEGAVRALRKGGVAFVGDVRSLPLLEAFHTSIQLAKAPDSLRVVQLRERIREHVERDKELVLDPEFFRAFAHRTQHVLESEVHLKRGRAHNELTRFRYDVFLHVGTDPLPARDQLTLDWRKHKLTAGALRQHLEENRPEALWVRGVPNARLATEARALELLEIPSEAQTVGELRELLRTTGEPVVDPEELWSLGDDLLYEVQITYSMSGAPTDFDVFFRRCTGTERPNAAPSASTDGDSGSFCFPGRVATAVLPEETPVLREELLSESWSQYANNPLRSFARRNLVPQLRRHLEERLRAQMVPNEIVVLEALPLAADGTVNRSALPAPDSSGGEFNARGVAALAPQNHAHEAQLRDHMRSFLPDYMVPAAIVFMEKWPQTPNGKLDRRALPAPEEFVREACTAPRTPTEATMAAIWGEVLDRRTVGIHDNFFDLGGHSLAALRVFALVRDRLKRDLPVTSLLLGPTIAQLASLVDASAVPLLEEAPERRGGSRQADRLTRMFHLGRSFVPHLFRFSLRLGSYRRFRL
jgi:amino acid adenylation domain-containing protein